jgi:hypothetical protein
MVTTKPQSTARSRFLRLAAGLDGLCRRMAGKASVVIIQLGQSVRWRNPYSRTHTQKLFAGIIWLRESARHERANEKGTRKL